MISVNLNAFELFEFSKNVYNQMGIKGKNFFIIFLKIQVVQNIII